MEMFISCFFMEIYFWVQILIVDIFYHRARMTVAKNANCYN